MVSKLISLYKDCPEPDDFDFPMAICIWKHIEAIKSGRQVTMASPFRRFVYFPNPSSLPTPGKRTVNSFQTILVTRKERQTKKAKIREKISKNIEELDAPIEVVINALEEHEEDEEELDDLLVQLETFPCGQAALRLPRDDVFGAEAVSGGSLGVADNSGFGFDFEIDDEFSI